MKDKSFANMLARKLGNLEIGEIEVDGFDDKDGGWVKIKVGDMELEFGFDKSGENIDMVGLYKGEDCEKIWAVFKPFQPKPEKPIISYKYTSTQVYTTPLTFAI